MRLAETYELTRSPFSQKRCRGWGNFRICSQYRIWGLDHSKFASCHNSSVDSQFTASRSDLPTQQTWYHRSDTGHTRQLFPPEKGKGLRLTNRNPSEIMVARLRIELRTRGFSVANQPRGLNQAPVTLCNDEINFRTFLVLFGSYGKFLRLAVTKWLQHLDTSIHS